MKCLMNGLEVNYPCFPACALFGDCVTAFEKQKKANVRTNADHIRAMNDEELAALLLDGCRGSKCDEQPQNEYGSVNCFSCRLDWLKQPVKDGKNDG